MGHVDHKPIAPVRRDLEDMSLVIRLLVGHRRSQRQVGGATRWVKGHVIFKIGADPPPVGTGFPTQGITIFNTGIIIININM